MCQFQHTTTSVTDSSARKVKPPITVVNLLSCYGGAFCPGDILSRNFSGAFCPGDILSGGILSGGHFVQGALCSGFAVNKAISVLSSFNPVLT